MKDENNGLIMTEFCGLRSKMYATKVQGGSDLKKSKGIKRNVVDKTIQFENYFSCMMSRSQIVRNQNTIKAKLHKLYSMKQAKVALNPHDSKRYIDPEDCSRTLPYGHKDVPISK